MSGFLRIDLKAQSSVMTTDTSEGFIYRDVDWSSKDRLESILNEVRLHLTRMFAYHAASGELRGAQPEPEEVDQDGD